MIKLNEYLINRSTRNKILTIEDFENELDKYGLVLWKENGNNYLESKVKHLNILGCTYPYIGLGEVENNKFKIKKTSDGFILNIVTGYSNKNVEVENIDKMDIEPISDDNYYVLPTKNNIEILDKCLDKHYLILQSQK